MHEPSSSFSSSARITGVHHGTQQLALLTAGCEQHTVTCTLTGEWSTPLSSEGHGMSLSHVSEADTRLRLRLSWNCPDLPQSLPWPSVLTHKGD